MIPVKFVKSLFGKKKKEKIVTATIEGIHGDVLIDSAKLLLDPFISNPANIMEKKLTSRLTGKNAFEERNGVILEIAVLSLFMCKELSGKVVSEYDYVFDSYVSDMTDRLLEQMKSKTLSLSDINKICSAVDKISALKAYKEILSSEGLASINAYDIFIGGLDRGKKIVDDFVSMTMIKDGEKNIEEKTTEFYSGVEVGFSGYKTSNIVFYMKNKSTSLIIFNEKSIPLLNGDFIYNIIDPYVEKCYCVLVSDSLIESPVLSIKESVSLYKRLKKKSVGGIVSNDLLDSELSKSIDSEDICKSTIRMSHKGKFGRKVITKNGKVRYDYTTPADVKAKENQEAAPKEDPEQQQPEQTQTDVFSVFDSMVSYDDSESSYLFGEIIKELPEEVIAGVLLGMSSVNFFEDSEKYFKFLGISEEQRLQDEQFEISSGCYGVMSGRIAYNNQNMPEAASNLMKRLVMAHELGHAFFYGILRYEHKRLFSESLQPIVKQYNQFIDASLDFINEVGVEDVPEEEGSIEKSEDSKKKKKPEPKKKEDKKESIAVSGEEPQPESYVSQYAALNPAEQFAENFSYYFIAPDTLRKLDGESFEKFNKVFGKYNENEGVKQ